MRLDLDQQSSISIKQFRWFRAVFGIFLCWHFLALLPYAGELFSSQGIINRENLNPFHGKWISPFFLLPDTIVIQSAIILGGIASLLFATGKLWRCSAIYLWLLSSWLFTANPLTANPSLGYIGLLLLLCAIVPKNTSHLPVWVPRCAWILLAVGYTFSGLYKLGSPSWIDGSAIAHLMENPLARPGISRDILMIMPDIILKIMTWSALC